MLARLPQRPQRRWLTLALLATLLGAVFAVQSAVSRADDGSKFDWPRLVALQLWFWYAWAALTPLAFTIAARTRIDERPLPIRLTSWLALGALFAGLHTTLFMAGRFVIDHARNADLPLGATDAWWWYLKRSIAQDYLDFALIAAAYQVTVADRREREVERERARVEAELGVRLAAAELGLLRTQLQPHFLFNTLNTVSSLIETDTTAARRLLVALGDLFRLSLDRLGRHEVRLAEEIDFVTRYLDIQKLRFGDRLDVRVDVDEEVESAWVPSLVLQPLVENAMRHAVEPSPERVRVRVAAATVDERLQLSVADDGRHASASDAARGHGIGIANTRRRLEQLYGARATVTIDASAERGYAITLQLPLHTQPAALRPAT